MKISDRVNNWLIKQQNSIIKKTLKKLIKYSVNMDDENYWILRNWYQSASFKYEQERFRLNSDLAKQAEKEMKEFIYTHPKVHFSSQTEESFKTLDCFKRQEGNFLNDLLNENRNSNKAK